MVSPQAIGAAHRRQGCTLARIVRIAGIGLVVVVLAVGALVLTRRDTAVVAAPTVAVRGVSANATNDNGQQKLARTTDGALYLAYTASRTGVEQAEVAFSLDGGENWKPEIVLAQPGVWSALATVASGPDGRLDAAWVDYSTVGHVWHASKQAGVWSEPEKISPGPDYAGYPAMVVEDDGTVEVVWYASAPDETREHGSVYEIHHTTGVPGSWSPPTILSDTSNDALNPALTDGPDGTLHAAWFQIVSDTYVAQHATFSGGAWDDTPEMVSPPGTTATGVALAVGSDGVVHMVWEQTAGHAIGVGYSRNEGSGWSPLESLSTTFSEDPVVALDGDGRVYVLWSQEGRIMGRVFDGGWSESADLGRGTNPTVLGGDTVVAAWTAPAGDSNQVVTARLRVESRGPSRQAVLVALVLVTTGVALALRRGSSGGEVSR